MKLKPLYKMAKTGKIVVWEILAQGNKVMTTYGVLGGKQQSTTEEVQGKNLGRSNETSPEEQAKLLAQSKWNERLNNHRYSRTKPKDRQFEPMLAYDASKDLSKFLNLGDEVFIQPKLDGVRCIASCTESGVSLLSRKGKDFGSVCSTLVRELQTVMIPGEMWDGEIYLHGYDFQDIISAVKKSNDLTPSLQYHVFDIVSEEPFERRFVPTRSGNDNMFHDRDDLLIVPVSTKRLLYSQEAIEQAHLTWVEGGYEGLIIRKVDGKPYIYGRSSSLLKYKAFDEDEFEIIGFVEGKGRLMDHLGTLRFASPKGEFEAKPKRSMAELKKMWKDRVSLVGKRATVKFWGYTKKGLPRHGITKEVRDYE